MKHWKKLTRAYNVDNEQHFDKIIESAKSLDFLRQRIQWGTENLQL